MKPASAINIEDIFVAFHQKLVVAFRTKMEDMNFTFSQMETLRFVIEQKNPTMKDIAVYLGISAPSATSMIQQLSRKNLIKRGIDRGDRRTVRIVPTTHATTLFASFMKIKSKIFSDMLKNLNVSDKKKLASVLRKLI